MVLNGLKQATSIGQRPCDVCEGKVAMSSSNSLKKLLFIMSHIICVPLKSEGDG